MDDPHRPTRDLDLLGFGDANPDAVIAAFRDICAVKAEDAVSFDAEGLTVDRIRDEADLAAFGSKPRPPLMAPGCGSSSMSAFVT